MVTPKFSPEELQELHDLAARWAQIVSKRAFGSDGPGLDVDFRTFEQIATAAAQGLTEGTLQLLLAQQADKLPDQQPCPTCGKLCPTQPHTRQLTAQGPRSNRSNESLTVPTVAGTFSPLRAPLGLDEHAYSSSVIQQVVWAAGRFSSFRDATDAVKMTGIKISETQVRRLAREVSAELIAQRDQKVITHRRRQLTPRAQVIPQAVVVEVDGGRIRTRAADAGPGVHEAQNKEDKVACLATLKGPTFVEDPCPEPPQSFPCPRRVQRLVNQMKRATGVTNSQEISEESMTTTRSGRLCDGQRWSPRRLVMTCVASMQTSVSFGPLMAAEAQERGFYQATRRAFVADGSAYNWSIQSGYFADFEPITDFLHVLCYVYSSARAVSADEASGWSQYLVWQRACWQGRVAEVLEELDAWHQRLGEPPSVADGSPAPGNDPRVVVPEARTYLRNNQTRMAYPRYRRSGLPTTSSLVESLVGEVNTRVKSKQKYWTRGEGSEAILQLRAAVLSQDERLDRFFANRPGCAFRKRPKDNHRTEQLTAQTAA